MPLLAVVSLSFLGLLPQGQDAPAPVLTPAEQKSLHDKAAEYLKTWSEYETSQGKARDKVAKPYNKAKEDFQKEWEARVTKKGDLLKSMADLQAIFGNFTLYESRSSASLRKVEVKGLSPFWLSVPKNYKADKPCRTVLLIPGQDDAGAWVDGQRYFEATWDKSASVSDVLFHIPVIPKDVDLNSSPDYTKTGAEELETQRNQEVLGSYGETQRGYNVDRARLVLDAGKGAAGYALRALANFPGRFAGLILRHPDADAVANLRLGSLNGTPILLLSDASTAESCAKLKERIEALYKDSVTVLSATDAYPYKAATADLEKWMGGLKREYNRKRIVLEPGDSRFKAGYWAYIGTCDTIHTAPPDKRVRLEVEADRASNRIQVKAVGIEDFTLLLNDSLLDLDKEFTVVVNDRAVSQKLSRSLNTLLNFLRRRQDGDYLFTVEFSTRVPKPEDKPTDGGTGK